MKLISWNVNGLRACINKGFLEFFNKIDADIFCVGETKMHENQAEIKPDGYKQYWNSAVKKGYSGTAVFTKIDPISVNYGIREDEYTSNENEGRAITLEFDNFFLVNVYTPNSQRELTRLAYRMNWEDDLRSYLRKLDNTKPVIMCGDLNVAHNEIDLKNPKSNIGNAGFTYEEREKFNELLKSGFVDSYRHIYPDITEAYTWWSYMFKARERNIGWRIDYFIVSEKIKDKIEDSLIFQEISGSDHCPVGLIIKI